MKISLNEQISEIDRELGQREQVYPRLVSAGKLRQSIADYQVARLKAARASLVWLRDNQERIRATFGASEAAGLMEDIDWQSRAGNGS